VGSIFVARFENVSVRSIKSRQFFVEMSDALVLTSFSSFSPKKKRDWVATAENFGYDVRVEIKNKTEVYLVAPEDFFENSLMRVQGVDLSMNVKQRSMAFRGAINVSVKRAREAVLESLVEELAFDASVEVRRADEDISISARVDLRSFLVNFKPDFLETLAQFRSFWKGEKRPNFFNKFQVINHLETPITLTYNDHGHIIEDTNTTIFLHAANPNSKPSMSLFNWAKHRKCAVILSDFVSHTTHASQTFLQTHGGKRLKSGRIVDPKSHCELVIAGKKFDFDFERQEFYAFPVAEHGELSVLLQTSVLDMNYCLNLRTNVKIKNNSRLKIVFRIFRCKGQLLAKRSSQQFEEEGAGPKPEQVIKAIKLRPNQEFYLPFTERFSEVYYSITLSGKVDDGTPHSLAELFEHRSSFVVCPDGENTRPVHFSVLLKDSPGVPLASVGSLTDLSLKQLLGEERTISIEPPVKVTNKLPVKFRLIFANEALRLSLKKSMSISNSLRSLSETPQCEIDCGEFSDEPAHKFSVLEFNQMFINSTNHTNGIILADQDSSERLDALQSLENDPRVSQERLVVHVQNSFENLVNAVMDIRRFDEQFQLTFSSELLILSELTLNLKVRVKEDNYEYERINLPGNEQVFKDDAILRHLPVSYFSLEDLSNQKTLARLFKRKAAVMGCFTGDIERPDKQLKVEGRGSKVELSLMSFKERARQLLTLNKQTVYASLLQLDESIASRGILFFYYPFYIVNKSEEDLLIKAHNFSDKLLILKRDCLFPSEELLPPQRQLPNCEFVLKGNTNDSDWSDSFCLFLADRPLANGSYYLRPRPRPGKVDASNLSITVSSFELSQLITITKNTRPNFRICNNLKTAIFVSQFDRKDSIHEAILQNSVGNYFYQNSFVNNELCLFRRETTSAGSGKFILLHKMDLRSTPKPVVVDAKGFESFEVMVERDNEGFVIRVSQRISKTEELNWRSAGPRLRGLVESTFKNRSLFPFNMEMFSGVRLEASESRVMKLSCNKILVSFCDNESKEIFLMKFDELEAGVTRSTSGKTRIDELSLTVGDFQFDSQVNFELHNVG
jgi:hypothetical protein